MIRALALLLVMGVAAPAGAQSMDDTLAALERADSALQAATDSRSQRGALGQAIRAYERAMRQLGLDIAEVASETRKRTRALAQDKAEVRALMGGLLRMGQVATPLAVAEADNPADALRAMLLLERATAAANSRARTLVEEQAALEELQASQAALLSDMRTARARMAQMRDTLIANAEADRNRIDGAPDIGEDAANLATLAIALDSTLPGDTTKAPLAATLLSPVEGTLARGFSETDPAGLSRPGVALSAAPGAIVTAPGEASVRFVGQLDGYGRVVILEPQQDVLLVLAGLGTITARAGETVPRGGALGFMPQSPDHEEFSQEPDTKGGLALVKTLYMELRHDQQPIDPAPWFEDLR
ncbi:murein hydrolase activator EnvC family protein [Oceanibium sediminis]|uniref:murein hydrolase activator EnvC family protein n=1 Tax=Oceanibium sediminis TaxID=2026339 RepID=UPI000DD49D98|nr:peptidoglycan DD-metalloendopeptidase family protein [Oceanibium sediminis]